MPFIDTRDIESVERRPGWRGRVFHSETMTFAHWDFDAGSTIHEHHHEQEEVWHVLEGQLEVTIDGVAQVAGPGMVAIVPAQAPHSVRAVSNGKAIVADYPVRPGF
jgi:quercetin dioxygenase-like cupin family protein